MLCYFSIAVISGLKSLRNLKVYVNPWYDFQLKLLTALQVCDSIGIRMFTLFLIFLNILSFDTDFIAAWKSDIFPGSH